MKVRSLYTLLFYLLLPAIILRLLFRSLKAPDYRHRWTERFGIFPDAPTNNKNRVIWVHAVSVGETLAAVSLIRALQKQYADHTVMITTTTPTGSAQVKKIFIDDLASGNIQHVYAPYDIPFAIHNFLHRVKPRLLVIMETEVWPNLIHVCAQHHIPVVLANARLSKKSARGYHRLHSLIQPVLEELTAVAVQSAQDAERFVSLGMNEARLQITGSIKFDLELSDAMHQQAAQLKAEWSEQGMRLVWLAASTHPGEDEMILTVFAKLRASFPALRLILVPRHPERFNTVYQQCLSQQFHTQRCSDKQAILHTTNIVLGDTMGELLTFFGACDIAFVGGSLVPVGGHNLVEPAAWATATITGKHLHNFAEISALLLHHDALVVCDSTQSLQNEMQRLLSDTHARATIGKNAQAVANENRGALHKLLALLHPLLTASE